MLERVERDIRPRVHIFGHVHEGYGVHRQAGVVFINAASKPWPLLASGALLRDPVRERERERERERWREIDRER